MRSDHVKSIIPLHNPIMPTLSTDERHRYSRQIAVDAIGVGGQRRLCSARALVVGAGGLSAPIITYLVRAGVGTVGVIDPDIISLSNLHRQILFDDASLGCLKTERAVEAMRAMNPDVEALAHPVRIDETNAISILSGYDIVLNGSDNFATQYVVDDAAAILGIPHIWGSVLGTDGQVSTFWSAAPGGGVTLRDLYPFEPIATEATCSTSGVIGPLCGHVGSLMALEAMKLIAGFGRPLIGRVLAVDVMDGSTTDVSFARSGDRVRPAATAGVLSADLQSTCPDGFVDWIDASLVAEMSVESDQSFVLIDVREIWEREISVIPGSRSIPLPEVTRDRIESIAEGRFVIVHCKHSERALKAHRILVTAGFDRVKVLHGGIDSWSADVDPNVRRY